MRVHCDVRASDTAIYQMQSLMLTPAFVYVYLCVCVCACVCACVRAIERLREEKCAYIHA